MIVTAYTRCSTDMQDMSIPDQIVIIEAYCNARGYTLILPEKYSDQAKSGTTFEKRSGVMALISDVLAKQVSFTKVIIHDETRWGRPEDADDSTYFELSMKRAGVIIEYAMSENHPGIVGRISRDIKYDQASNFSKRLGEDVLRRLSRMAQDGVSPGGSPPIGYERMLYDSNGNPIQILKRKSVKTLREQKVRWVPGPPESVELVKMIFQLALTHSVNGITRILFNMGIRAPRGRPWGISALMLLLKNRAYLGERVYGGTKRSKRLKEPIICPLAHEPIIDREAYDEVQRKMESRRPNTGKGNYTKSIYLLTGKLTCLACGYRFIGKYTQAQKRKDGTRHKYRFYQCSGYERGKICRSFIMRQKPIDDFVIECIEKMISDGRFKARLTEHLAEAKRRRTSATGAVSHLAAELAAVDREIARIQEELLEIPSKSLRIRLLDAENRKEAIQSRRLAATNALKTENTEKSIHSYLAAIEHAGKAIRTRQVHIQKQIINCFLEKGDVDRERREVRLQFFDLPDANIQTFHLPNPKPTTPLPNIPLHTSTGHHDGTKQQNIWTFSVPWRIQPPAIPN